MGDFEHRVEKFKVVYNQLTKNYERPQDEKNEERLETLVETGTIPWNRTSSPESRDLYRDYFIQHFFNIGEKIVSNDWTEEEVREKLESKENADMPRNMASDGSKGQWRVGTNHSINVYRWFLGEWDGKPENYDSVK